MSRNTFDFKKPHEDKSILSSVEVGKNFGRWSFFLVKTIALISFVFIF